MALVSFKDLFKSLKEDCCDSPARWKRDDRLGEEVEKEPAVEKEDLVILSENGGNYSLPELLKVRRRPFACRWYMTAININWQAVWLRTHFTDNTKMRTPTRRIRDLAKATITDKVKSLVAKAILADVLTSWFEMDPSDYLSMASMMGSVLSEWGDGVTFETSGSSNVFMIKREAEQELSRLRFTRLIHILFNKVSIEDFLVKNENANIYRLTYCLSHTTRNSTDATFLLSFMASMTSFFIQMTFAGFIVAANYQEATRDDSGAADGGGDEANDRYVKKPIMILLAILTFILSSLLGWPEIKNSVETRGFYHLSKGCGGLFGLKGMGLLIELMDTISNMILPFVLTISGFLIILIQEDFIDAVLNSTALLFILEIDDLLPSVLQLDPVSIVRNFLIGAAVQELGEVLILYTNDNETISAADSGRGASPRQGDGPVDISMTRPRKVESLVKVAATERELLKDKYNVAKIQYADMILTNSDEKGTDLPDSFIFAPYEIQGSPASPDVSNSNFVTSNCLLRRIEWRYTYRYPMSRFPRVGLFKVWKLDGGEAYDLLDYQQADAPKSNSTAITIDPHKIIDDPHYERMKSLAEEYPDPEVLKQDKEKRKQVIDELDSMNTIYAVEGVYMITVFEVSETLLKLRICGSKTAAGFADAMDTYSLWDLDASADSLISKHS